MVTTLPDMTDDLADRLLDAHVTFVVEQLTGDDLERLAEQVVDELLAAGRAVTVAGALDVDRVKLVARRLLSVVPPSPTATVLVSAAADVVHDGPSDLHPASDLLTREHVERMVDEVVRAKPLIASALDDVVDSPLIASVVSRFVARVVGDVVASNRAAAERLPGIGGLVSFGAGAASKVVGAGASGVEQLLGDTAGKGAQIAARRLNKVVVDTLEDPQLKAAVLQLWDARSDRPLRGIGAVASADDVRRLGALAQDVAVHAAASPPVIDLVDRLIDLFFEVCGDRPVAELLADLGITQDDVADDARVAARQLLVTAHDAGVLEPIVRARLEPFYRSSAFSDAVGD